jgi:hypothetical protein
LQFAFDQRYQSTIRVLSSFLSLRKCSCDIGRYGLRRGTNDEWWDGMFESQLDAHPIVCDTCAQPDADNERGPAENKLDEFNARAAYRDIAVVGCCLLRLCVSNEEARIEFEYQLRIHKMLDCVCVFQTARTSSGK